MTRIPPMTIELTRDCAHGRKGRRFNTAYHGWCNMLIRSGLAKEVKDSPELPVRKTRKRKTERAVTHG